MGATQAVWILKPARQQRLENALRLARDDLRQTKALMSVKLPANLNVDEARDQTREQLELRLAELQSAAAAIGLDPDDVPNWQLNMTNMIETVSQLVHREDAGDSATWYGASLLWRLQSGHAHGTFSARIRQIPHDQLTTNPDGTLSGRATTSLPEVGSAAAAAVLFLNEAWRLYDDRSKP